MHTFLSKGLSSTTTTKKDKKIDSFQQTPQWTDPSAHQEKIYCHMHPYTSHLHLKQFLCQLCFSHSSYNTVTPTYKSYYIDSIIHSQHKNRIQYMVTLEDNVKHTNQTLCLSPLDIPQNTNIQKSHNKVILLPFSYKCKQTRPEISCKMPTLKNHTANSVYFFSLTNANRVDMRQNTCWSHHTHMHMHRQQT